MKEFTINPIGCIRTSDGFKIKIEKEYISALKGLDEFKYIQVIYWFDRADNKESRSL